MATIILRGTKGSPLTSTELDNNFNNLNIDIGSRVSLSGLAAAITQVDGVGSGIDADLVRGLASSAINAPSTVVTRDGSGNFSANIITATLTGTVNGTVTNGVVTTGSYADPAWITSLSPTKVGLDTKSVLFTNPAFTGTATATRLTAGGRSMIGQATIDLTALDQATYYPIIINLPPTRISTMRIEVGLNSGTVPTWSTHPQGFALFIEWSALGNGWGTIPVQRTLKGYTESWTTGTIVGGLAQMTQSNNEVIYLRGGGKYFFSADNDLTPIIVTASYTVNGQTIAPSTTIINTPASSGTASMSAGSLTLTSSLSLPTGATATLDTVTASSLSVNSITANSYVSSYLGGYGQLMAVAGSGTTWYNAMLRNDGGNVYLLSSAPAASAAAATNTIWNAFRPFYWNLTTGDVYINASNSGNTFIGSPLFMGGSTQNTATQPVHSKNTCKAWVSWVGQTAAIYSSYNVSSVTRTAAGYWTINFTSPLIDANGCVVCSGQVTGLANYLYTGCLALSGAPTANTCSVQFMGAQGNSNALGGGGATGVDIAYCTVAVFR